MTLLSVMWGRHWVTAKPTAVGGPRGRKLFWANAAVYLNGAVIQETATPVTQQDTSRLISLTTFTAPNENPEVEAVEEPRLHVEEYDLPAGSEVALWLDRGDDKGRFANYPAFVICQVLDEPLSTDNTLADLYAKIGPVKVLRIEHRESAFFMSKAKP